LRKITKGSEPIELISWKRKNPHSRYEYLSHIERAAINKSTRKEQFGLCAYCCKKIDQNNSINEHVEAQKLAPNRTLDFSNIVASCKTLNQCDAAHGSQYLPLTPLMDDCEKEFKFNFSGEVKGLTNRAKETINVLNLNNRLLIEKRKKQIRVLIIPPDSIESVLLWDNETIDIFVSEYLQKTDDDHLLDAYTPVLVNILKQRMMLQK
jgi:uncharacterized protein (TIGR02646 family)